MTNPGKRRTAVLAGALLAMTFGVGVLSGVALDRWLIPPKESGVRIMRDYSSVLDALELTVEQRTRAQALMEESNPASESVLRRASEELRQVADSVDQRLREILTPEQQARLDTMRRQPVFIIKRRLPSGATTVDTLRRPSP
jgi:Spy/CpxP family protein refolding chaperone